VPGGPLQFARRDKAYHAGQSKPTAPIHRAIRHILHSLPTQVLGVSSRHWEQVNDNDLAARFEHSKRLTECLEAPRLTFDVVDRKAGNDNVEHGIREGHRHHVPCLHRASFSHTFEFEVPKGCLGAVFRLVDGAPKIKTKSVPTIKAPGNQAQDGAATATHVEDLLVAP